VQITAWEFGFESTTFFSSDRCLFDSKSELAEKEESVA
jgi:hypothetical protein